MFAALVASMLSAPTTLPQEKEKAKELPEAAKKELKALEGKWKLMKGATSMGEEEIEAGKDIFLIFKGDEMIAENGPRKDTVKITAIDSTTNPKCIDLTEIRSGKPDRTIEAVYRIEKDTLQIALGLPGDGKFRPTGFDKPTDERTMVWTMKRVKE